MKVPGIGTLVQIGTEINKGINSLLPVLHQEVNVVVQGAPFAKRYDLYWIAAAAAFGQIINLTTNRFQLPTGMILLEYNSEQNYVRFYCKQVTVWKDAWANMAGRAFSQVLYGPKDSLTGGTWEWSVVGGRLAPTLGLPEKDLAKTGWEGEPILTKNVFSKSVSGVDFVSQNPTPLDGISRGGAMLANNENIKNISGWEGYNYNHPEYLLYQLLAGPCDLTTTRPVPNGEVPAVLTGQPTPNNTPIASVLNPPEPSPTDVSPSVPPPVNPFG